MDSVPFCTAQLGMKILVFGLTFRQSLCGGLIFLLLTLHHDPRRVIWQRPLQRLGLVPRCTHPDLSLIVSGEDHRHCLWMDRLHHRIGLCREETVDLMRPRDRLRLGAAVAVERGPYAREGK